MLCECIAFNSSLARSSFDPPRKESRSAPAVQVSKNRGDEVRSFIWHAWALDPPPASGQDIGGADRRRTETTVEPVVKPVVDP